MTAHVNRYDSIDSFSWMTTPFTRTADGFLSGRAIVTNIGVFTYKQADGSTVRELRLPEEVFNFASLGSVNKSVVPLYTKSCYARLDFASKTLPVNRLR